MYVPLLRYCMYVHVRVCASGEPQFFFNFGLWTYVFFSYVKYEVGTVPRYLTYARGWFLYTSGRYWVSSKLCCARACVCVLWRKL